MNELYAWWKKIQWANVTIKNKRKPYPAMRKMNVDEKLSRHYVRQNTLAEHEILHGRVRKYWRPCGKYIEQQAQMNSQGEGVSANH